MKNVFGIAYDKDGQGQGFDGERFIVRKAGVCFDNELESFAKEVNNAKIKTSLPMWLSIIKLVAGIATFIIALSILNNLVDTGISNISKMLENAPAFFIVGGVSALTWLSLFIAAKVKYKRADGDGAFNELNEKAEKVVLMSEEELEIPHDAPKVDIMMFKYTEKNGKIKFVREDMAADYVNNVMRLFREGDNICLANLSEVFAFPADGFTKLILKKKKAAIQGWNKEEVFDKGEYKQYKIRSDGYGGYICRYYALQYADTYGEYEILFPEYELKQFEKLMSLPKEAE